jgi:hypothetical protein
MGVRKGKTMRMLKLILVVAGCMSGPLNASVLSYSVTPGGGGFNYQLTLTNDGATGGSIFDLFLSLPIDINNIDTANIGTPVGWGDATGGLLFFGPDASPSTSFIDWAADFSGLYDVQIGATLSGFSFNSTQNIAGPITFALNGNTDFAAAEPASTAPEPGTFVLLVPVLAVIAACRRVRINSFGTGRGAPISSSQDR